MTPSASPVLYWPNLDRKSVIRQRAKEIGIALSLSFAVALFGCVKADAKTHRHHRHKAHHHHVYRGHHAHHHRHRVLDANGNGAQVIGSRPSGCPHAWCGCGLARYLGISDARLNLAWNWARFFPRTQAHPGAAAVRSHHVMLLEQHVGGNRWLVRDYNGGRGLAWLHVRDVRGYVFVEPRSRSAQQVRASEHQS